MSQYKFDKKDRTERKGKFNGGDRPDRHSKTDRPEKGYGHGKSVRHARPEKFAKPERHGKPERYGKSERQGKPEHREKTEHFSMSDRPARSGQDERYSKRDFESKTEPKFKKTFENREKKAEEQQGHEEDTLLIRGRHEVLGALAAGQKIETIFFSATLKGLLPGQIREMASKAGIPVKEMGAEAFSHKFGEKSQGIVAIAGVFAYAELETLIENAKAASQIIVALNQVEDPRNLGAIVRTVEAAGCAGVVIAKHRSAGMTEWAVRTAQGAAAHLPVARVTNIADALVALKDAGFWVVGLDGEAKKLFCDTVYRGPIVLVAGGEDAGLGDRVKKSCDELVSIPLRGHTSSLNVSVSTAVVLFEICRQKEFFQKL